MRIQCDNCSQALDLPDDKIPQQRFSVACPACQNKILVDPPAIPTPAETSAGMPAETASAETTPEESAPTSASAAPTAATDPGPATNGSTSELAPLRGLDRDLLESLTPAAILVDLDPRSSGSAEPRLSALRQLGMREIQHATSIEAACEMMFENEVAILLVQLDKVPAPPCPPLEPIYKLPFDLRRKTFVAVMAENVKTLDGQVAFYLQVNCLIQSAEKALTARLRRALLHHLRLYRHWHTED